MRTLCVAVLMIIVVAPPSARSSSAAFYWCGGRTIQHSDESYYSDAFESDESGVKINSAWDSYMKATYNLTPSGGCQTMAHYHSLSDARSDRDKDAAFYR